MRRAIALTISVATLAACGSDEGGSTSTAGTAPNPPQGGVFGLALAGPTCPVETPDEPCPPQPVDAEISAQDAEGDVVATTRTDADGKYTLTLAPGDYTLVAETGVELPWCEQVSVTVPSGSPIRADIPCDTGIR